MSTLVSVVKSASTEELRKLIGAIMTELRLRKADAAPKVDLDFTKVEKAAARDAAKAEYKARKAEVASRPFGVARASDGKLLKRRFNSEIEAIAAAAELTTSMKAAYAAVAI